MNDSMATPLTDAAAACPDEAPLAAAAAQLAAWQASGAPALDPVRLAWMAALVRRGAARPVAVQRQLLQRLAPALAAYEQGLACLDPPGPGAAPAAQPATSALAALLQHIQRHACHVGDGSADAGLATELKTLHHFRAHWQRLRLEKRLTQARATVPGQAGPLNSHSLVLQALTQLQALSPAYLQHFLAQVDTLLWLEQAQAAVAAPAAPAAGERRRRPARLKPG